MNVKNMYVNAYSPEIAIRIVHIEWCRMEVEGLLRQGRTAEFRCKV